jgi:hypothetical protein
LALAAVVILPLYYFPVTRDYAIFFAGVAILATALTTLLRVASLALGGTWRPFAIARNVLTEAVRLKVSAIFIVILVFALAALPGLLDPDTPLRYRVQSLLQWGLGGTFFIISVLTVVFSVATVAFEQRDKVIWQTMTKPVSPMSYVLGKWLGVVSLAAVLLLVSSTGVFVFTEYLRRQPANGEVRPYEPRDPTLAMTEDRLILETRVLTARKPVVPAMPFGIQEARFDEAVAERVAERERLGDEPPTPADLMQFREEAFRDAVTEFRSIDPNTEGYETYEFYGLRDVKRQAIR